MGLKMFGLYSHEHLILTIRVQVMLCWAILFCMSEKKQKNSQGVVYSCVCVCMCVVERERRCSNQLPKCWAEEMQIQMIKYPSCLNQKDKAEIRRLPRIRYLPWQNDASREGEELAASTCNISVKGKYMCNKRSEVGTKDPERRTVRSICCIKGGDQVGKL